VNVNPRFPAASPKSPASAQPAAAHASKCFRATRFAADGTYQQVPLFYDGVMIHMLVNAFGKTLYSLVDTGFTMAAIDAKYKSYPPSIKAS
jgi:hypothetical protein